MIQSSRDRTSSREICEAMRGEVCGNFMEGVSRWGESYFAGNDVFSRLQWYRKFRECISDSNRYWYNCIRDLHVRRRADIRYARLSEVGCETALPCGAFRRGREFSRFLRFEVLIRGYGRPGCFCFYDLKMGGSRCEAAVGDVGE